jgi:hypothetical protein
MSDENTELVISAKELRNLLRQAERSPFMLGAHFDRDNIVEIAKNQFQASLVL